MKRRHLSIVLVGVVILLVVIGVFTADPGSTTQGPVDFDETVSVGLTLEDQRQLDAEAGDVELPRVQVFYSQYSYVVGYYGVEQFVRFRENPVHEQQFGQPLAVYVTTYDGTDLELTSDQYPQTSGEPTWNDATEAHYVVDSEARTPNGETVVPFADEERARAFAAAHGGDVLPWQRALGRIEKPDEADTVRADVTAQHQRANETVSKALELLDRPVQTVVGEDVPTLTAAVETAPPESTIVLPSGTYETTLDIDKPLTLRGEGDVELIGDWDGDVINVSAPDVAIDGVTIRGVGSETPGASATQGHDHGAAGTGDDQQWDAEIEDAYATGDAAIATTDADGLLVRDTTIHTDASGIILRDSPDSVVTDVTVHGASTFATAHMGVVAMRSPGVIQRSTFRQGLDGVYTHRADGITVRNNRMFDNRMGIHLMHTSGALLADNQIASQADTGIFVMTGPERNALVGNRIRDTPTGIDIGGTDSYIADNLLRENTVGLQLDTTTSIVEGNLLLDNRFGAGSRSMLPTNRVADNDFIGNDEHISSTTGPVRIWTHDGSGNYWDGAVGVTDGETLDRPYIPTDSIDSALGRRGGTETLAQAPVRELLTSVHGSIAGAREGQIIDTAPRCEPVNRDWLEARGRTDLEPICHTP